MKKYFFLFLFLFSFAATASANGDSVHYNYDTNFIAKYPDKIILALYQSNRHYDVLLQQFVTPDTFKGRPSNANYFANADNVTGISFDYDIFGFTFGYNSVSTQSEKLVGKTTYYSYGLSFATKGLRIENTVRSYKGFYDKHSPVYDSAFSDTGKYFQNPSMTIFTYKTKAIYVFKKKKFSLSSCYANTSRQLKSSFTWILLANIYGTKMHSDSSLVPRPIQSFYGSIWNDMNTMNVIGFSGGGGASGTFVIKKKFYVNFLLGMGLEGQHRKYTTLSGDGSLSIWQPSFAMDWRASVGYNGRKFFLRLSNVVDYNYFYTSAIHIDQKYVSGEFSLGWRFGVKTPKIYKKFQDTKIYSYF